jgi:hypothetical protein
MIAKSTTKITNISTPRKLPDIEYVKMDKHFAKPNYICIAVKVNVAISYNIGC